MKRFSKSDLAYALQIMALVILFSYGGCSPNNESKIDSDNKTSMISKPAGELKSDLDKFWEDHVANAQI